jgi:pimeloyl-ACP methyl ester carboxylesterase
MSHPINTQRRRLLGTTSALAGLGLLNLSVAQARPTQQGTSNARLAAAASLGAIRQINAGTLDIGYAELGPSNGPVAILLHGWPYDIYSFAEVAPQLVAAGYRVIVPYLRGYGSTRFLSADTPRNGQQGALAVDVIALMDALKIDKAVVAGFDWGARTACIVAAQWPERFLGLVSVSVRLRHRARRGRLCREPERLQSPDLATGLAEVEFRRRDVPAFGAVLRQPGPRGHRDPQLPLAPGTRSRRIAV